MKIGETAQNQVNLPKAPAPGAECELLTAVVHCPRLGPRVKLGKSEGAAL